MGYMCFINSLTTATPDLDMRILIRSEFIESGFLDAEKVSSDISLLPINKHSTIEIEK